MVKLSACQLNANFKKIKIAVESPVDAVRLERVVLVWNQFMYMSARYRNQ